MSIDKIIVSVLGFVLMSFVYWFFFGKKNENTEASENIEILVSGGYKPGVIKLKKNKNTRITLKRTDANTCLEEFIIPDLKIKKYLPVGKDVEIVIKPTNTGIIGFNCSMNMYHGKFIVE